MAEQLTKIVVDLPHHPATGGEGMWARELGDGLFEVQNVPFHAYGLNYLDVVRAVAPAADRKPEVQEVVRPSGHSTLRIIFTGAKSRDRQSEILDSLIALCAVPERADSKLCALDIPPEASVDAVRGRLDELEADGELGYETCEPRVPGSFDDSPAE